MTRDATRRRWRGWLMAVLVAACVDGPTSPGQFGELRIRPSYSDGDAPTALGLSVDSAKVRVVRPGEPATALVDTMVRYASDTASLGWILTLRAEEEPLLVDVAIWDDDNRVYSGEREVLVRESDVTESGAEPVLVAYVGPAIVKSVTVSPASVTLEALHATAPLTAEARDRHDQVVATVFSWSSGNPDVATVDPATGAVIAVGNGTTTIHALAGSANGSATVVVAQRVRSVAVTPESPTLTAIGATLAMQASVRDANGFAVAEAGVTWASSNDGIVRVDAAGTLTAVAGGTATITASSGGIDGGTLVTVNPVANVASITVSPADTELTSLGATTQFTAVARDADGGVLSGVQFTWTSSATNVATISETGLATSTGHGSTTITATAGSVSDAAALSVDLTEVIAQIVVTPGTATLSAVGSTTQFLATAKDGSGNVLPGVAFEWTSSDAAVATVDPGTGLATVAGHGIATIMATANGVFGTALLTANLEPTVASIVVSPPNASLGSRGATAQFTAVARDAANAIVPGVVFSWTSSDGAVATIDPSNGIASATGHGSTTIVAAIGEVQGTASLTVDLTATITSIVVSPATATLGARGATQQFTAEARDAGGTVITGIAVTWTSSASAVATVDAESGLATVAGHGHATITATANEVSGAATLTADLTPHLARVVVTPSGVTLTSLGATQQFVAEGRDANDAVIPGLTFGWTSSSEDVAAIDASSGLATVTGNGTTTITARAGSISGTSSLSAELRATVTSIVVSPSNHSLGSRGATAQFTAIARDENNAVVPGVHFTWLSSNEAVATIGPSTGLATATGHGSTTIVAAIDDVQGGATLTVDLAPTVARIVVTPATVTLTALGATQQFVAEARDASDAVIPGMTFIWTSSAEDVATIDATSGLVTVTGNGSTTITARAGSVSGTSSLSAELRTTVTSIVVSPAEAFLGSRGGMQQFTAVARDANNAIVPGVPFTWSSSNEAVATIDPSTGLATATGHGSTTIVAAIDDVQGGATLTVDLAPTVVRIVVTPAAVTLRALGATQQFVAEARDGSDAVIPGMTFAWTSSEEQVATVGPSTGLATVTGDGATTITASANGISGTAALKAELEETVASITVTPASASLTSIGATQQFIAVARDANNVIVPGVEFTWTSSIEAVATVDPTTGLATATGHGATNIVAAIGEVHGSALLTVNLVPTVARVVVTPAAATLTSLGATQQFTAEARDASDAVIPGIPFSWTSSAPEVASIGGDMGLATVTGNGASTIAASANGVSGTAILTADLDETITSIVVSPASASLATIGATQLFTAVARDANNAIVPGVAFTWSSSSESVATVDPATGLATAARHGETNIVAAIGDVQGSASLTVDLRPGVVSIVVSPSTAMLYSLGKTQQFTAVARDAGGAVIPGIPFTWTSSATDVATVDEGTGLATAVGNGFTSITATAGDVSASAQLTVRQRVVRVEVTPSTVTIEVGAFTQLIATAYDANDRVVEGRDVSWSTSSPEIAKVNASGRVEGIARGTATIKAFVDDVRGTAAVTVVCALPSGQSNMLASIIVC